MAWDEESLRQKRNEVMEVAAKRIAQALDDQGPSTEEVTALAEGLLEACVRLTPPEAGSELVFLITADRYGRGGGRTTKPGNLRINIGQVVIAVAGGTLTVMGAMSVPWTLPLAALVLWNEFYSKATVEIGEFDASVIWAMWLHRDHNVTVDDAELLDLVNGERRKGGMQALLREQLDRSLRTLEKLKCIKRSKRNANRWWLREWVNVDYR